MEIQNAQFLQNALLVPIGESITIRVTNSDTQNHNLRLAGLDGEYTTEDDAVAAPDGIPAGGTAELILAPAVPGQYTFRCDFHPGTMGGIITVE